jgi:hypothetical protein
MIIVSHCYIYGRALAYTEHQIQQCINQDDKRQPIIIDIDTDIDDLWAIHYLLNVSINGKSCQIRNILMKSMSKVPSVDVLAITTVGDGYR